MKLPSGRVVTKTTSIYPGSNFTWAEVTKNLTRPISDLIIQGKLYISDIEIEENIVEAAKKLDFYRKILGDRPLIVTSWYRPALVNQRVGGAKYSRHQYGDAIDILSNYKSPREIYSQLDSKHNKGGMGKYYGFVHIDFRGTKARW